MGWVGDKEGRKVVGLVGEKEGWRDGDEDGRKVVGFVGELEGWREGVAEGEKVVGFVGLCVGTARVGATVDVVLVKINWVLPPFPKIIYWLLELSPIVTYTKVLGMANDKEVAADAAEAAIPICDLQG